VAVDIQGEVQKPGVYQLKDKSLVKEAIDYAGGLTEGADTKQVNQAQRVTDQMKIFIPKKGESTNKSFW
jgi:Periplasmic protein involved in polysaccharide export